MIFSNVNIDEYKKYPAAIRKAVEFLKSNDFTAMEPGTYKIEGDDIYANVFDALTEPAAQRNPESH
ncbi:MAG TPA: YhcH/YjgK/YiaL family protein, partial [Candidatus Limivicinus faecipullorum]|nr:YhcH/YjgK/YiaL family protein [Candidatus Limivicinus faecipullorum]